MHAGGRPTLQTDETVEILCDAISHGLSNEDAAALAGIGTRTLYEWLADDEFAQTIRAAKARRKLIRVKALENADPGHWQRYAWLLQRSDINFCTLAERLQFMIAEIDVASQKTDSADEEIRKMLG